MVRSKSEFIHNPKERKKAFEGRAATLLKLTSELATLCDTPACVVIHNPDDINRPWRIWPESESQMRSMIELYKSKNAVGRSEGSNRTETKAPRISRTRVGCAVDFNGGNGLTGLSAEEAKSVMVDLDREIADVQNRIDSKIGKKTHQAEDGNHLIAVVEQDLEAEDGNQLTAVVEQDLEVEDGNQLIAVAAQDLEVEDGNPLIAVVAQDLAAEDGNQLIAVVEQDLAEVGMGMGNSEDANHSIVAQPVDNVIATATADGDIAALNFDGQLWDWDENDLFEIDQLLNLSDCEEDEKDHCLFDMNTNTCKSTTTEPIGAGESISELQKDWETTRLADEAATSLMSEPEPAPAVVGNKRKREAVQVFSFSELISPTLQRRKVEAWL